MPPRGTPRRKRAGALSEDPLVAELVPDPSIPADAVLLAGFLGRSTEAGVWRLYLTPDLSTYVEVAEDDILHHRSLEGVTPLGGTALWVRAGTQLKHLSTSRREVQAEFLTGPLAAGHAPSHVEAIVAPEGRPTLTGKCCWVSEHYCLPTKDIPCPTIDWGCGSGRCPPHTHAGCYTGPPDCPASGPRCPYTFSPLC
jgi:hypothetical protein